MAHLTRHDYHGALALLAQLEQVAGDASAFLDALPQALQSYVAFESAVLSTGDAEPRDGAAERADRLVVLPLSQDSTAPIRLQLRRRATAFSARDRQRLALLQPHLAFLASHTCRRVAGTVPDWISMPRVRPAGCSRLTLRESDVMYWLSCGKTDADIGAFLSISTRTVHKHLEHIYEKLGVETRTAAVMAVRRSAEAAAARGVTVPVPAPSAR
jgi:DNA-binding CsgD family transcriptional regulator